MAFGSEVENEELFTDTRYHEMPRLFAVDDYDECPAPKGRFSNAVPDYCMVTVRIDEPKEKSRLFNFMKKFSSNEKQHFQHVELKRGVCLQTCFEVHENLEDANKYKHDDSLVMGKDVSALDGMKNAFNKLCNVCINRELLDHYGLVAKTSLDYCVDKNESFPMDLVDIIFVIASISIAAFVTSSIMYGRNKNAPKVIEFFDRFKRTKKLLEAFSVEENWRKLMEDKSSNLDNVLSRLYASKIAIMFFFVFSQVYSHITSMPFANPISVEKVTTKLFALSPQTNH